MKKALSGIDVDRIAVEVNQERKRLIEKKGVKRTEAFEFAFSAVMKSYPILGSLWRPLKQEVGRTLSVWAKEAREKARKNRSEQAKTCKAERLIALAATSEHMVMLIDSRFEVAFRRGLHGRIVANVRKKGGTHVAQRRVPTELMKLARAHARAHFRGAASLSLDL